MRFHKLRIAWSAFCGIAAVLLVVLWVRSYWVADLVSRAYPGPSETTLTGVMSERGNLSFGRGLHSQKTFTNDGWSYSTSRASQKKSRRRLFLTINSKGTALGFPTWLPAILLAGAAVIPWMELKWNFSVYTLLVAMTVLALVLSLVMLVARK